MASTETTWDNISHQEKLASLFPYGHLNVGAAAWAIVGMIAIKVTIEEIQDWRRPHNPCASVEYWVDEPVGHALQLNAATYSSLCPTKEKAVEVLMKMLEAEVEFVWEGRSLKEVNEVLLRVSTETLAKFRTASSSFIRSTLIRANSSQEELDQHDEYCRTHYQPKAHLDRWFNCGDILAGNV